MKFLTLLQTTFKNAFYIDYFFKNVIFYIYKKLILSNFYYLIDKYLAEQLFLQLRKFFSFFFFLGNFVKNLDTLRLLKIIFLLILQILLILFL